MKTADLAIVVPTLNEQFYIGGLLDSIISQTVLPKEIAVVDAYSQDDTLTEVQKRQNVLPNMRIYQIPRSTISKQRNFGASKTRAKRILFLDADIILKEPTTLESYYNEVIKSGADIAAASHLPLSDYWRDKLYYTMVDTILKASIQIWPAASASNMYIQRKIFNETGGFDEEIVIGEDVEFTQRVIESGGKFVFLKNTKLHNWPRRLEKEGRGKYIIKMIKAFYFIHRYGFKNNPIEYEFGNYPPLKI